MPILRPGDVSTKHRNRCLNELVRSNDTRLEPEIDVNDHLGCRLLQVAQDDGSVQLHTLHFKTSIATSIQILEHLLTHANPKLRRRPAMTGRDYILHLLNTSSGLDRDLCMFYVDFYERSRFGNEEFTFEQYTTFEKNFESLLDALDRVYHWKDASASRR